MTVLRSPRTVLRPWTDDDLAPFARMNADPVVMEYFPATLSRAESDAQAARIRQTFADHGFGWWVLEVPGELAFGGCVGLSLASFEPPFRHTKPCVEIGWRLAPEAWGKGYATEAARAVLAHGFGVLGLEEIVSFTSVVNVRSQRVMQRIGMTLSPGDDFDHPRVPEGHRVRRHVLYRIGRPTAE